MDDKEALTILLRHALDAPEGRLRLSTADELIITELERNRFNTERAVEIYTFAIDNIVWAWVKKNDLGRLPYRSYSQSGLGKQKAVVSPNGSRSSSIRRS
jgi:hypothetical protein